uniref:Retrovirus-related Pol polyprotein LINE-1 n=1 Tax=Cajanus cajan TaxID=3821 RepID=A0A151QL09_CAJCA|nr:Retrovirus-related Pol polyprotein LINE-1 [Cajanus cajan]
MNVISWNCRGAGSKGFATLVNDLVKEYNVGIICLLETHISGSQAQRVIKRIKLDKCFMVEARGQAGGLWVLWDSTNWTMDVLRHSNQMIHFAIKNTLNSWNLTVVYGSPLPQFRIELWRDLRKIASEIRGAWSLIGDFNAVLADNERQGGSLTSCHRGDNAFRELVRECNLIDMGYQRNPFTWRRGMLYERLDRVLMNLERRKNRVLKLQNENGDWIDGKSDLENMATTFYKNLFAADGKVEKFCLSKSYPQLSNHDQQFFEVPFSDQEIFEAMKRIGSLKAPGPDGFQAIFYQSQWEIVGPSLCKLIHDIQEDPSKVAEINHTFLTLIPKVEMVTSMKQMRPISLCNVSYKVLTKMLATRLRRVMESLVGPSQCSFVPNRQTTDHAKSRLKTNQHIGWIRPPNNTLKLNCDGAVDGNAHAACGGVLRDCLGKFIFGFAGKIGTCSVLQAELWAIFHGLRIIKEMNLKGNFLIESDSEIAVKLLNEGCSREHPCYSLVNHIVRVAGEIQNLECSHILREANQVADRFAKHGFSLSEGVSVFTQPPGWVNLPLFADKSAVTFPRGF